MSKDKKVPQPSIEGAHVAETPGAADAASGGASEAEGATGGAKGAASQAWEAASGAARAAAESEDLQNAVGFVKGLGATAWKYAGSHPYTVFYGFVGLILAVLILTIGLWDTIVIAIFVCVGAMIGQIRDGDNGIVNFFSRLISGRH
ncbi:DUF2273 domain-containing protein [Collinsella sp. An2]|uniref:DUF2273 domain-containing protein n=1 Tax=Collinsella sp. An2 TaxID=1965585 RepID=UPI001EF70491|nr:DUF2273 domain-containing protein [Collinsella sp. An2]